MKDSSAEIRSAPSSRLRVWLIVVTVLAVLGIVAAIPGIFFGIYMGAFAADDPSAGPDAVWNFWLAVGCVAAVYLSLLISGVAGGWIAYRKRRNHLAFGLSLLTAAPIFLIVAAILVITVVSTVWTAAILK